MSAESDPADGSTSGSTTRPHPPSGRRRRRAAVAALALAAVLAAALLASTALRHHPLDPPLTADSTRITTTGPTASASPSPTPSGTPSPTSAPTVDPGLPPYYSLTAQVLAGAGAGWLVGVYEPTSDVDRVYPRVLVLSPDGTVYRAADPKLDHAGPLAWHLEPVRWDAGSQRVVVELGNGDSTDRTLLDLLTGALVTDTRGLPESSYVAGLAADGSEVRTDGYGRAVWVVPPTGQARRLSDGVTAGHAMTDQAVDPSGRFVAVVRSAAEQQPDVRVLDLTTNHVTPALMTTPAGHTCDFAGWAAPARVMLICAPTSGAKLADSAATFDVSGATPVRTSTHDYVEGELRPALPALLSWVGPDRLLTAVATTAGGSDRCTLKAAWFDSAGRAVVPQGPVPTGPVAQVSAAGGTAYTGEWSGCPESYGLAGLTSVTSAGQVTTLIPPTPADQAGTFRWAVAR